MRFSFSNVKYSKPNYFSPLSLFCYFSEQHRQNHLQFPIHIHCFRQYQILFQKIEHQIFQTFELFVCLSLGFVEY